MNKTCKEYFGERLKSLRSEKGLSQDALSKDLGISKGALCYYENCDRTPDITILDKVAKYFDVSLDYLMGYSENLTADIDLKAVCKYTGLSEKAIRKITKYNEDDNTTFNDICESLQFWFFMQSLTNFVNFHKIIVEYSNNKSFSLPDNEKELYILDNLTAKRDVEELHAMKFFNYLIDYLEQLAGEHALKKEGDLNAHNNPPQE